MNQLEQIEQRWAKATPGLWLYAGSYNLLGERDVHDNHVKIMNTDMTTESFIGPMGDGDATAIANAPTDIEYLVRRLKAAEAVIKLFVSNEREDENGKVVFFSMARENNEESAKELIDSYNMWREVAE